MTEVAFHFNAPDKRAYTCRLLRKGFLRGARLLVLADAAEVKALDSALWLLGQVDFIPHCHEADPPHVQAHSPIRIFSRMPAEQPGDEDAVLVNLRDEVPPGYPRFARVIEVVAQDDEDRRRARERWRLYRSQGVEPLRHDLDLVSNP